MLRLPAEVTVRLTSDSGSWEWGHSPTPLRLAKQVPPKDAWCQVTESGKAASAFPGVRTPLWGLPPTLGLASPPS